MPKHDRPAKGRSPGAMGIVERLRAATAAHRAGRLADADEQYDAALKIDPHRVEALAGRATVALQTGRAGDSLPFFARAMAAEAVPRLGVRINYATALRKTGRHDEAVDVLLAAVEVHPGEAAVHGALGMATRARGDLASAALHLEKAIALASDSFEHSGNLGVVYFELEKFEDAVQILERASALAVEKGKRGSDVANLFNTLGRARMHLGDPSSARAAFDRAIGHDPSFVEARSNLGGALLDLGDLDGALAAHRSAVELGRGTPGVLDALGVCQLKRGEIEEAVESHRAAVLVDPSSMTAFVNFGTALRQRGALDEAERAYRRGIELDPHSARPLFNLGALLQSAKRYSEAIDFYRRALARDPTIRAAYLGLSWLLSVTGQQAELDLLFAEWRRAIPGDAVAEHMTAARSAASAPSRASPEYVASHFDDFAAEFDDTLERLGYCAPQLVADTLRRVLEGRKIDRLLDAGCGTGLCGPLVRPMCSTLEGVDLSPGMLDLALRRGCYDRLVCADLVTFLGDEIGVYDAVIAADVLIYFGDLTDIVAALARSLRIGGVIAFTVEEHADEVAFKLGRGGRYSQARAHASAACVAAGIEVRELESVVLRQELGQPVAGCLVLGLRAG